MKEGCFWCVTCYCSSSVWLLHFAAGNAKNRHWWRGAQDDEYRSFSFDPSIRPPVCFDFSALWLDSFVVQSAIRTPISYLSRIFHEASLFSGYAFNVWPIWWPNYGYLDRSSRLYHLLPICFRWYLFLTCLFVQSHGWLLARLNVDRSVDWRNPLLRFLDESEGCFSNVLRGLYIDGFSVLL